MARRARGGTAGGWGAWIAGVALALLLAAPAQLGAQEPAPEQPQAEEPKGPEPIPVSSIAAESSALTTLLQKLEADLEAAQAEADDPERFPETQKEIRARTRRLDHRLSRGYDRDDLDGQDAAWRTLSGELERWEAKLNSRLESLDEQRSDLAAREEVWSLTETLARKEQAPEEVREQVRQTLAGLRKTDGKLKGERNKTLTLQKNVVELRGAVTAQKERIAGARDEVLGQLLRRTAPYIWLMEFGDFEANKQAFTESHEQNADGLADYFRRERSLLWLHAAAVLMLVWVTIRARSSMQPGVASGGEIPPGLRHPLAAGLVLGLTSGIWIHPTAPPELGQLMALAVLPYWVVVLRELLPRELGPMVLGLTALLILDHVRRFFGEFPAVDRLVLVLESASVFGALLWLRRPRRLANVPRAENRFWFGALSLWLRAALGAAAFSLGGAIFGWLSLSELLAHTIVGSTFVGTIFFTGVRVVEDIAAAYAGTGALDRIRLIRRDRRAFLRVVSRLVRLLAGLTWVGLTLESLTLEGVVFNALGTALSSGISYGNLEVTVGGVLAFGVAIWVSWLLSRFLSVVLESEVLSRVTLPRGVPFALSTITRYTILVVGFVAAVAALGFELSNLTLVLSALGVGIGFGMQNMVNNFVSGLMLLFERPIKVGDMVQVQTLLGRVTRIGIRASTVRTFDGADVIVPNGELISNQVTNWTLADTHRRVTLPVGVVYGTPARTVIDLLLDVGRHHPEVLEDPEPVALFTGFGNSSLDFELRIWTESPDALTQVRSDLAVAIQDALAQADIEVPFPQRDLHLKSVSEDAQKLIARPTILPEGGE